MAKDPISAARAAALRAVHGGPGLVLTAPYGTTVPTKIEEVLQLEGGPGQFAPLPPWTSVGITRSGIQISRGFEKVDREADQTYGSLDHRPTSWTTTIQTEMIETSPEALRLAWAGSPVTQGDAGDSSELASGSVAGGTSLSVKTGDGSKFAEGDIITVGTGSGQEWAEVASIATDTVTLTQPLTYAHATGEKVFIMKKETVSFGTRRLIEPQLLAVIAPLTVEDPSVGGTHSGLRMWLFRRVKLDAGQRQMTLAASGDWTLPVSFVAFPDLAIEDPDNDTFFIVDYSAPTA